MIKLRGKLYPLAPWAAGVLIALMGRRLGPWIEDADGAWTFSIARQRQTCTTSITKCEDSNPSMPPAAASLCQVPASGSSVSNFGNGPGCPPPSRSKVATTAGGLRPVGAPWAVSRPSRPYDVQVPI